MSFSSLHVLSEGVVCVLGGGGANMWSFWTFVIDCDYFFLIEKPKGTVISKGNFMITWTMVQSAIRQSCRTWLTLKNDHPLKNILRAGLHRVPSPKFHTLEVNLCNLNGWEHGSYHFTRGPKLKVPSMTWMPTWHRALEARVGSCVESWVEHNTRPNSQHKSWILFAWDNEDTMKNILFWALEAQKLRLCLHVGTPC